MKKSTSSKLLIIALLTLFGCKAKKQMVVQKPAPVISASSAPDTSHAVAAIVPAHLTMEQLGAIQQKQIGFVSFAAKAKAKINIDGNSNDVTLNIRIKKNQAIWVSVTAVLGLEGARALITPDSIKIINRLDATYTKKPFSYVYQYAGKQVNFQMLEALIIGNAIPGTLNNDATVQIINGNQVLSGTIQDMLYQLIINSDMRVSQTTLSATAPAKPPAASCI
jgi:hypothetical protein